MTGTKDEFLSQSQSQSLSFRFFFRSASRLTRKLSEWFMRTCVSWLNNQYLFDKSIKWMRWKSRFFFVYTKDRKRWKFRVWYRRRGEDTSFAIFPQIWLFDIIFLDFIFFRLHQIVVHHSLSLFVLNYFYIFTTFIDMPYIRFSYWVLQVFLRWIM